MSDNNELIIALQEWSDHFVKLVHPVALTINRAIAELTATKQQLDEVTKQRDALQEWKESAMQVGSSWDAQAIGELIGVQLGCAILPQIEPAIRKMIAQRDERQDRLTKLSNASSVLWEEHKAYSLEIHGVEGCDYYGSDSDGHEMMQALVEETLAAKGGES